MEKLSLPQEFKEFLKLLNSSRVEYLLIGGFAVIAYGHIRFTNDIDVWVAMSASNAKKVVGALKEFGFDTANLSENLFVRPNQIVRMGVPPLRIEVLTTIAGVEFDDCYARRIYRKIDGVRLPLIQIGDLRKNKKASGRHKDLDDLENLPES